MTGYLLIMVKGDQKRFHAMFYKKLDGGCVCSKIANNTNGV